MPASRAPRKKAAGGKAPGRQKARSGDAPTMSARLGGHVSLAAQGDGRIAASFHGRSISLGPFSAGTAERAQDLRAGLPLASFASGTGVIEKEIESLVRHLARRNLIEYCLRDPRSGEDQVVVEPQTPGYWPGTPALAPADVLVLSRFAYMRRRGNAMVLESPRAGALFRICDPAVAGTIATLSAPRPVRELAKGDVATTELLALLVGCEILFKVDAVGGQGLRPDEGDGDLVLWDFHDLLFHTRSVDGRHANPSGGYYQYAHIMPPPPAVRVPWPGQKIDLDAIAATEPGAPSPAAKLLRQRHSTRSFDDQQPITLAELARFLNNTARVLGTWSSKDLGDSGPEIDHTVRPYPSAGASYELELYLAIDKCDGLSRGFYHYDAGAHALVPIEVRTPELDASFAAARFAMGVSTTPHIVITIAARFGRVSWKYSSFAYALVLKDAGVLTQTLYLVAADMGLGGCAIGSANIELFAKMTRVPFHVEGPVGQFALGRGSKSGEST